MIVSKCIECFFCRDRKENEETIKRCSVTGRKLTDESEACSNIMKKS